MNVKRILLGGAAGTAAITMLMLGAPLMGLPRMPIGEMLGAFLGIGSVAGWAMHVVIGLGLAVIYAGWFAARLSRQPVVAGAIYGFGVFLVAQLVVSPLMGGGVFSGGSVPMIIGSLLGHLAYGGVVGAIYGAAARAGELARA